MAVSVAIGVCCRMSNAYRNSRPDWEGCNPVMYGVRILVKLFLGGKNGSMVTYPQSDRKRQSSTFRSSKLKSCTSEKGREQTFIDL